MQALQSGAPRAPASAGPLDGALLAHAAADLAAQFDAEWGGFGGPPKFPDSGAIALLLRQFLHSGDDKLLEMATMTLDHMACGGIHDQLGGGFHRYAVDAHWLTPHFEKMLYDNALLAGVYLEAWQATAKDLYRRTAADILDYVLRDMRDSRGGFHSSQDADSEGIEGRYYLWRPDEIEAVLGREESGLFCEYYGVTKRGNFEGEQHPARPLRAGRFRRATRTRRGAVARTLGLCAAPAARRSAGVASRRARTTRSWRPGTA